MEHRLTGEAPIATAPRPATTDGVPLPFVRLFPCSTGRGLIDEFASLATAGEPPGPQALLPIAAKLLVPAPWHPAIAATVASLPGLTLSMAGRQREDVTLLLLGPWCEIAACADALASSTSPAASLGVEMLQQLRGLDPQARQTLVCAGKVLDFSVKTGIMGILNVTPDSFYDGGRYLEVSAAVERAQHMVAEGADIIDIGGQSTRPGSKPISEVEEAKRVLPVVKAVAQSTAALISVDTYRAGIARAAIDAGAHLINDISALRFDPALLEVAVEARVPLILMHMKGEPRTMHLNPTYEALIDEVYAFLRERLRVAQAGGMAAEHLLIDPGIGFGKGARHNLELLRKLHHLRALGHPIVIGTSRKSFIGRILGAEVHDRLEGTAATVAAAIMQGAAIVRVHDVQAMARLARMTDAIVRPHFDAHAAG